MMKLTIRFDDDDIEIVTFDDDDEIDDVKFDMGIPFQI